MTEQPMGTVDDGTIEFDWTVPTDQSTLWKALTSQETVSRWMSCDVVLDHKVGGVASFGWPEQEGDAHGEVVRFEPETVLEYTWGGDGWNEVSNVTWQVTPVDKSTSKLNMTHAGLTGKREDVLELAAGWHDFMGALMSELGEPALDDSHEQLVEKYKKSA